MFKVKDTLFKLISNAYFPFFCFFVFYFVLVSFIADGWGDDAWFLDAISKTSVFEFLKERYYGWSPRLIIEFFLVFFVKNKILWRLFNAFINTLGAISVAFLTGNLCSRKHNVLSCFLIFLIPQKLMFHTGMVATTLNYSWPLFLGIFSLTFLKKLTYKKSLKWYEYLFFVFSSSFASNQGQMCIALFLCYSSFFFYNLFTNKKFYFPLILPILINAFFLFFALFCPGTKIRYELSIMNLFPEFKNFSFFEKLELGFFSTFYEILMKPKVLFFIFAITILICIFSKTKKILKSLLLTLPAFVFLIFNFFRGIFSKNFLKQEYLWNFILDQKNKIFLKISLNLILDFLFLVVFSYFIFLLYMCFEKKLYFFITFGTLVIGFLTRMIMSFSPTIFISGERTFIFFYFSIALVTGLVHKNILHKNLKKISYTLILLAAFITPFNTVFTCVRKTIYAYVCGITQLFSV